MSFFNLRRGGQPSKSKAKSGANASVESVDIVRKRAKHRLIGAAVLVLLGVVGFPLLFDSQPRPVPVDIAIDIPNKNTVRPLLTTPPVAAVTPVAAAAVAEVAEVAAVAAATTAPVSPPMPAVAEAAPISAPKKDADPKTAAALKIDDSARAQSLLEGKPATALNPAEMRLVVQVGAFADAAKAHEARLKLEKAGLKTYTQVADTKDGKRTRVRVGPFANRADADSAAVKIKALGMPAAILTL
jgi:DedD protein